MKPRIHAIEVTVVSLLILSLAALFAGGCTNLAQKSAKLNADTHANTAAIEQGASAAVGYIDSADTKVKSAATQADVPATAKTKLNGASADLGNAKKSLAPIPAAVAKVNSNSDQQQSVTEQAVAETRKVKQSIGYRTEEFLKVLFFVVLPIAGVVMFIVKTAGGGAILGAFGEIVGNLLSWAWSALRFAGKAFFHVSTLGLSALADKVNQHYDQQQLAAAVAKANSTVASVAPPAAYLTSFAGTISTPPAGRGD